MTDYDDRFAETAPKHRIFADKSALDPLQDPDEVVAREDQQRRLATLLNRIESGYDEQSLFDRTRVPVTASPEIEDVWCANETRRFRSVHGAENITRSYSASRRTWVRAATAVS